MNKTLKLTSCLGLASLLALPLQSFAQDISYSFIQADYVHFDPDGFDSENGWDLNGNIALGESFYLLGNYGSVDLDIADFDTASIGLGWHTSLTDRTDFLIEGSYQRIDVDSNFGSVDENGFGVAIGIRSNLNDHLELGAKLGYNDFGDDIDGFTGRVNALFKINSTWGLDLAYETDEDIDVDIISLGVRANF